MNKPVFLTMEGIGRVYFRRSKRARNINITVRPVKGVVVTVPMWASYSEATEAVVKNIKWIEKQVLKMDKWVMDNASGPDIPFDIDRADIENWLVRRTRELAGKYGFDHGSVSVREQTTRWGSCSSNNNISLNAKLAWLPDELVEYVIVHELMHTRIKDHGSSFWKEMDKIFGDAKKVDRGLKGFHLELL